MPSMTDMQVLIDQDYQQRLALLREAQASAAEPEAAPEAEA
jgi:hypothetical protein